MKQLDEILNNWLNHGQARIQASIVHHTLAQIILLSACFVIGGMIELSVLSSS